MLQISRVTAFTIFELLTTPPPLPPSIDIRVDLYWCINFDLVVYIHWYISFPYWCTPLHAWQQNINKPRWRKKNHNFMQIFCFCDISSKILFLLPSHCHLKVFIYWQSTVWYLVDVSKKNFVELSCFGNCQVLVYLYWCFNCVLDFISIDISLDEG